MDKIVADHSGGRRFALIFAEFLTEFASYYRRYGFSHEKWIRRNFGKCSEYQLQPGEVVTKKVVIGKNAARCIKLEWTGFEASTGAQFYIDGEVAARGVLHLGEAFRNQTALSQDWRCYDFTSKIDQRLKKPKDQKCMLRRGAFKGKQPVNGWRTDLDIYGDGYAYFILTNAAEKMSETLQFTFDLSIGTNLVVDKRGVHQQPRKQVSESVKDGLTLMDSRVHSIAGGPGRLLIDGGSLAEDGIDTGFLAGVSGSREIDAAAVIVRTRKYMVALLKDKNGVPNSAMIIGDPTAFPGQSIMTLGTQGMPDIPSCGYQIPAQLEILEQSKERFRYRVSGDLFNFSPAIMMAAGSEDSCALLRRSHLEFESLEVSLPRSELFDGTVEIARAYPPMQDVYDDLEFRSGPSLGGLGTTRSLVLGDGPIEPNEPVGGSSDAESSSSSGTSSAAICNCHCPNIVSPSSGACFDQCKPVLKICPDPNSVDALAADAARYSDILKGRNLSEPIHEMLMSDFEALSGDTRSQIIREALWQ